MDDDCLESATGDVGIAGVDRKIWYTVMLLICISDFVIFPSFSQKTYTVPSWTNRHGQVPHFEGCQRKCAR